MAVTCGGLFFVGKKWDGDGWTSWIFQRFLEILEIRGMLDDAAKISKNHILKTELSTVRPLNSGDTCRRLKYHREDLRINSVGTHAKRQKLIRWL